MELLAIPWMRLPQVPQVEGLTHMLELSFCLSGQLLHPTGTRVPRQHSVDMQMALKEPALPFGGL